MMKLYQVIVNQSDGCSYSFDSTIAIYLNEEDAELHAMYANEKNEYYLNKNHKEFDVNDNRNPYAPDIWVNQGVGFSVEEIELQTSFTIKE